MRGLSRTDRSAVRAKQRTADTLRRGSPFSGGLSRTDRSAVRAKQRTADTLRRGSPFSGGLSRTDRSAVRAKQKTADTLRRGSPFRGSLFVAAALSFVLSTPTARADSDDGTRSIYRGVIDRVEVEPATIGGYRLRIYLSALALQGQVLDLTDPKSLKLYLGTSEEKAPYALGRYAATDADTAIVLVIQVTQDFADALPAIGDALSSAALAPIGEHTEVAVIPFGDAPGQAKLGTVKQAHAKLEGLATDGTSGDPGLLDALDRALGLLRKAKTTPEGRPLRKVIIIVGDGRDRAGDRDRVTRLGTRAGKEGVRIDAVAYSANKVLRPMLTLGELAKRSLGTFRWVRTSTPDSWTAAFKQLGEELAQQYVLTYFVFDNPAGRRVHLVSVGRTELTSNEVRVPPAGCGGKPCDPGAYCASDRCVMPLQDSERGILGWVLIIGGAIVGGLVILGFVGAAMSRRQHRLRPMMPPGVMPPGVMPPGVMPPGVMPPGYPAMPAALPIPPPVVAPQPAHQGPIAALLVVNGPRAGERLLVRNGFVIGKQPGCDLVIEDGFTSSQHAQIAMDRLGNCYLYDRGSTNGTFVNGSRIAEAPLAHGVVIRIGSTELRFLAQ